MSANLCLAPPLFCAAARINIAGPAEHSRGEYALQQHPVASLPMNTSDAYVLKQDQGHPRRQLSARISYGTQCVRYRQNRAGCPARPVSGKVRTQIDAIDARSIPWQMIGPASPSVSGSRKTQEGKTVDF